MPAYIRKQPLAERIWSALNIYDFGLYISEEIESYGWDQVEKVWALPLGVAFNLVFLIARANIGRRSKSYDDVFGEDSSSGWAATLVCQWCDLL